MRGNVRVKALLLVGLVFIVGVLFLVVDGATRQQADAVEPPSAVRWYPVSGGFTPEAYTPTLDLGWLNR